jgi:hypothetical protein
MALYTKIIYSCGLNCAASPEELTQRKLGWEYKAVNKDLEGCGCVIFQRTVSSFAWEDSAKYES